MTLPQTRASVGVRRMNRREIAQACLCLVVVIPLLTGLADDAVFGKFCLRAVYQSAFMCLLKSL